ncbi:hypothetical protein ACVI55_002482 [Sinorhizobium medicae]
MRVVSDLPAGLSTMTERVEAPSACANTELVVPKSRPRADAMIFSVFLVVGASVGRAYSHAITTKASRQAPRSGGNLFTFTFR